MGQTSNYGLNQWVKSDLIQMESFNSDNEKIDTALKANADAVAAAQTALLACGNCQIYYGTYVGKGSGTTDLTFPKKPLFVSIMGSNIWITAIQGAPVGIGKNAGTLNYGYNVATWSGNSLSLANNSSHMASQCNSSNTTYYVVALMDAST